MVELPVLSINTLITELCDADLNLKSRETIMVDDIINSFFLDQALTRSALEEINS